MDFAYFGKEPFSEMSVNLCRELNKVGIIAKPINWDEIGISNSGFTYKGKPFTLPKTALVESKVRTRTTKNQLRLVFDWLQLMEISGVNFINTIESTRNAFNKVYAAAVLKSNGINTPETRFATSLKDISDSLKEWEDIIIKPLSGHSSVRLNRLIFDKKRKNRISQYALFPKQEIECWHMIEDLHTICIQKYVVNEGRDIRVEVLNGKVLALFAKYAQPNSWRVVDLNHPSKIIPLKLTKEIEEISIKATEALGLSCASIDLVESPNGLSVIEVNASPSSLYNDVQEKYTIDPRGSFHYYVDFIKQLLVKEVCH